jgi:hypothetical protein
MKAITNFSVSAKHWQIFALVWGTSLAGQITIVNFLPARTSPIPVKVGLLIEAVMLPSLLCSVAWLWSLGVFLFPIVRDKLKLNIRLFQFAIIFSTLWLAIGFPLLVNRNLIAKVFLFLAHFVAMIFLLYAFCFVSKSLVAAEKRETVTFSDYVLSLILLLASIIGIWFIQPRINRLYAETAD